MDIQYFATASAFRRWLVKHHQSSSELWVRYYKKDSGKPSITYPESVDQALCFGWIDGVRHAVDEDSYRVRFTPRKKKSVWSTVNIKKVVELKRQNLMSSAGLKAFEARTEDRSEIYSFEKKRKQELEPEFRKRLNANKKARLFFEAQIPSYQRTATHWVMSAKKVETRVKRLEQLIADSEKGLWVPPMRRAQRK
jgi:uncharacterized protein YdeI (YjbR/CyaY-like superfamily)